MTTKKGISREIIFEKARSQYRRTEEASPIFEYSAGVIVASASLIYDIGEDDTKTKKYLPLSNIRIVNNSTENIVIFINQRTEGFTIPAGTIISLDKGTIPSFYSIKITNISATDTSAGEIKISVWRESLTIDDAYRRMHKAFYKTLYGFK